MYKIKSLKEIKQSDWELIEETGDLSKLDITKDNWHYLYDLYLKKLQMSSKMKSNGKNLKAYAQALINHAKKNNKESEMYLKLAKVDLKEPSESTSDNSIFSYIVEKFGFIPKESISVEDYINLYLRLKNGE